MRILAVADIHGRLEYISRIAASLMQFQADLLVVAGDLTRYRGARRAVLQLSQLPVPCLCMRGNTDRADVEKWMGVYSDVHDLHLKEKTIGSIHFAGVGGTVPLPFRSRIRLRERELLRELAPLVAENTILLAHPPPYGTLDRALGKFHVGSRNLHHFLIKIRPRLLICGHVHEDSGIGQVGSTTVVNGAMSKRCEGVLIELDAHAIKAIEIIKADPRR